MRCASGPRRWLRKNTLEYELRADFCALARQNSLLRGQNVSDAPLVSLVGCGRADGADPKALATGGASVQWWRPRGLRHAVSLGLALGEVVDPAQTEGLNEFGRATVVGRAERTVAITVKFLLSHMARSSVRGLRVCLRQGHSQWHD